MFDLKRRLKFSIKKLKYLKYDNIAKLATIPITRKKRGLPPPLFYSNYLIYMNFLLLFQIYNYIKLKIA